MESKKKKLKVGVIIQARMGSSRLPNKVLMEIRGKPMIWHVVERLRKSKELHDVILAIPDTKPNDILEEFAKKNEISYYRGSENDVLSRYYETAKKHNVDSIVRVTSDCPLIDHEVADLVVKKHLEGTADYTSNIVARTFPRGLDVEVFNFDILEKTFNEAKEYHQREHVTPYILEHPEIFKLHSIEGTGELRRPDLRLTVDTQEDFELINTIYQKLYRDEKIFSIKEVISLFREYPELLKMNNHIQQKSLKA